MRAFKIAKIFLPIILFCWIAISGCTKDTSGPTQPPSPVLGVDQDSLSFGDTTKTMSFSITNKGGGELVWVITKITDNGKPWICGLSPQSGTIAANAHEHVDVEVDRTGQAAGGCCGWVKIASNAGNDSVKILMNVVQVSDFFDNFSQGDGKWTFDGGTHSITNAELTMVSTEYYQVTAQSNYFSPYLTIPWTYQGDISILNATSAETDNGISVCVNDVGTYAVQHMWLSVRSNSSSRNWIWLWWVPSLGNEWLPWDNSCYGYSSHVYTDGRVNSLEMSVAADESFTLKANNYILSANNQAVNTMESIASIDVTLPAKYVKLRGGTGTTTKWDNILFNSETSILPPVVGRPSPPPPSEKDVDIILSRIARGEDVTLKSILNKKLGRD